MNPNKTECIIFATPNFNKRTETFQLTTDSMVKHMEDKVKKLGVIFAELCALVNKPSGASAGASDLKY